MLRERRERDLCACALVGAIWFARVVRRAPPSGGNVRSATCCPSGTKCDSPRSALCAARHSCAPDIVATTPQSSLTCLCTGSSGRTQYRRRLRSKDARGRSKWRCSRFYCSFAELRKKHVSVIEKLPTDYYSDQHCINIVSLHNNVFTLYLTLLNVEVS